MGHLPSGAPCILFCNFHLCWKRKYEDSKVFMALKILHSSLENL